MFNSNNKMQSPTKLTTISNLSDTEENKDDNSDQREESCAQGLQSEELGKKLFINSNNLRNKLILDSLNSEREENDEDKKITSTGCQSARNQVLDYRVLSQRNQDMIQQEVNRGAQVRIDSERSQFTQESCSAPENDSQEDQSTQKHHYFFTTGNKVKGKQSHVNFEGNDKPQLKMRKLNHFRSTDMDHLGVENQKDLLGQMQNKFIEEYLNQDQENKNEDATVTSFPLTNRSSPSKQNNIFGTFHEQKFEKSQNPETSVQQQRRRKESNPTNIQSSNQNSHNNLLSNDYNYSPDFKESLSQQPPLEQQSDTYSPYLVSKQRNSNFGLTQHEVLRLPQNLDQNEERPVLLQMQTTLLKYEEFDGECYTSSSHQNDASHGQVFFSGGGSVYHIGAGSIDLNRRYSERMSDRLYERAEQTAESHEDPFSPYNNQEDESPLQDQRLIQYKSGQQMLSPQNAFERKIPTLSIISEEDTQIDHSVNLQRKTTGGESSFGPMRMTSNELMSRLNSGVPEDQIIHDGKSHSIPSLIYSNRQSRASQRKVSPMNQLFQLNSADGPHRIEYLQREIDMMNQNEVSPVGATGSHKMTHSSITQYLIQGTNTPFPYGKSYSHIPREEGDEINLQRKSHDLKVEDVDDDAFMRMHSAGILRQSANGNNVNYQLISEEDLLSNIDKQSKLHLHGNDYMFEEEKFDILHKQHTPHSGNRAGCPTNYIQLYDEQSLLQKIRDQQTLIDQLKLENTNLTSKNQDLQDFLKEIEGKNQELHLMNEQLHQRLFQNSRSNQLQLPKDSARFTSQSSIVQDPNELELTMGIATLNVSNRRDAEIQVSLSKEKSKERRSSMKQRKFSSNLKQTPKRTNATNDAAMTEPINQLDLSRSTINNTKEYETPSMKQQMSVQDTISPLNTLTQNVIIPKIQYHHLLDELTYVQSQLQRYKSRLEKTEKQLNLEHDNRAEFLKKLHDESREKQEFWAIKINEISGQLHLQLQYNEEMKKQYDGLLIEKDEAFSDLEILKNELERYKQLHGTLKETIERSTSATSLIPPTNEQEIQTEKEMPNSPSMNLNQSRHMRSPSHFSMATSKKEPSISLPHTIPLPENNSTSGDYIYTELQQMNNNMRPQVFSSYSSKNQQQQHVSNTAPPKQTQYYHKNSNNYPLNHSQNQLQYQNSQFLTPQSITIINNKQELSMMLEQQKEYELRAMKLQNEIIEHKNRLIKEKQEILAVNVALKEEFRRKLKKREAKIEKYKAITKQLEKENDELKRRVEDLQGKNQNLRMKMESKVQEKEFKIIMMKSQIKQLTMVQQNLPSTNLQAISTPVGNQGGIATPGASHGMNRVYSQNELYNMINSVIQNQTKSQDDRVDILNSQRPKSSQLYSRSKNNQQRMDDSSRIKDQQSFLSPEEFNENSHFIAKNDSNSLIIPPVQSMRDSSGTHRSRRFDKTMVYPQGRILSPPLYVQNSIHYPRSVPRVQYHTKERSIDDNTFFLGRDRILISPRDQQQPIFSIPPPIVNLATFEEFKQERYNQQLGNNQELQSNFVDQKEYLREKVQQQANQIQQSRNTKRPQNFDQMPAEGLKSTFSDGDFMQMKRSMNRDTLERAESHTLQKQCTTEISMLIEEQIQNSRLLRGLTLYDDQMQYSQIGVQYPSLNIDQVHSKQGGPSSYHSATFRKINTNQHNSPQKNLHYQFEQAIENTTPGFTQPKNSYLQNIILDQEANYSNISLQQERKPGHYQLVPQNLQTIGSKQSENQEQNYLKNLKIREKQSQSRSSNKNLKVSSNFQNDQTQYGRSSFVDSLNEDIGQQQQNKQSRAQNQQQILRAPIVQSVSIVSDDYGTFTNQQSSGQHSLAQEKPPKSKTNSKQSLELNSKSGGSKPSSRGLIRPVSSRQRMQATTQDPTIEFDLVNLNINNNNSSQNGSGQGYVVHQYLTKQNSESRLSQSQDMKNEASQSAKNQKLEDIKRKYGRFAQ